MNLELCSPTWHEQLAGAPPCIEPVNDQQPNHPLTMIWRLPNMGVPKLDDFSIVHNHGDLGPPILRTLIFWIGRCFIS